jgi:hypothetical protein
MATGPEVLQMTIRELADFAGSLREAITRQPEPEKLRHAVEDALSGECVNCSIRVSGTDLLKLPVPEEVDPKLERIRSGYCARNGCDSNFYRVTCSTHSQIDWPKLLNREREITQAKAEEQKSDVDLARTARRHRNILRTATALGVLFLVIILRQIYMGGTIPFVREPEEFKVDRGAAVDGR